MDRKYFEAKEGYLNQWINSSIEQQIERGLLTRREKRVPPGPPGRPYLKKVPERDCPSRPMRKSPMQKSYGGSSPSPQLSPTQTVCNMTKDYYARSDYETTRNCRKKVRRCPLRIAELAEPTKRQCLNTWRSKGSQLPPFMLDRLRQHVMDQKVIASVSDAVNCFTRKGKESKKSSKKLCQLRRMAKAEDVSRFRDLSISFAHEIAKQLVQPMNICLSNEVQSLARIIGGELCKLCTQRCRSSVFRDFETDEKIITEMSSKIAIWVIGVLDDAYNKLTENDIRAKKIKENKQGKDGTLTTHIEKYGRLPSADLDEEEGPALDALDTVIGSVLMQVKEDSVEEDTDEARSTRTPSRSFNEPDDTQQYSSNQHSTWSETNDAVSQSTHDVSGTYDMDTENYRKEEMANDGDSFSDGNDTRDDTDAGYSEQARMLEDEIRQMINKIVDERHINVSEAFAVLAEEPDGIKAVQYLKLNDGGGGAGAGGRGGVTPTGQDELQKLSSAALPTSFDHSLTNKNSTNTYANDMSYTDNQQGKHSAPISERDVETNLQTTFPNEANYSQNMSNKNSSSAFGKDVNFNQDVANKKSSTTFAKGISFSSPKASLISFIDESWPDAIVQRPLLKSEVSKSITSLGKIIEGRVIHSKLHEEHDVHDSDEEALDEHVIEIMHNHEEGNGSSVETLSNDPDLTKELDPHESNEELYKMSQIQHQELHHQDLHVIDPIIDKNLHKIIYEYELASDDNKDKPDGTKTYAPNTQNDIETKVLITGKYDGVDVQQYESSHKSSCHDVDMELINIIDKELQDTDVTPTKFHECSTEQMHELETKNSSSITEDGKGDHVDTDSTNKMIRDAVKQKMKMPYDHKLQKVDYKVCPQTAPGWAINKTSDESLNYCKKKSISPGILQWCRDLEHTIMNLEQWNYWIDDSCRKILTLKQQSEVSNIFLPHDKKKELKEWYKFKKQIDKDAILWRKLNQRTLEVLNTYRMPDSGVGTDSDNKQEVHQCGDAETLLFDVINDIESTSSWLHRVIHNQKCGNTSRKQERPRKLVSTEYSARCVCKHYTKIRTRSPCRK